MSGITVGLDWGHERSRVAVLDGDSEVDAWWMPTNDDGFDTTVKRLRKLAGERPISVALETTGGPIVGALLGANFEVYTVNPKQVDRMRELMQMSAAKDDHRDAVCLGRMLQKFPNVPRLLCPNDPRVVALRLGARRYTDISTKITLATNQLRDLGCEYFPAMLAAVRLDTLWGLRVLVEAPTPLAAKKAGRSKIARIMRESKVRKHDADTVFAKLTSQASMHERDAWEAIGMDVSMLAHQLLLLHQQRSQLRKDIEARLDSYDASQRASTVAAATEASATEAAATEAVGTAEVTATVRPTDLGLIRSVPGIGAWVAAVLICEGLPAMLLEDLDRARAYSGVAPVTSTTGVRQKRGQGSVRMRRACNMHLRGALHVAAEKNLVHDPQTKARYAEFRRRGHTHGRALRQIADGMLRKMRAMLRDRTVWNTEAAAA